ncbi:hypothetical protein C8Q76DRAFT_716665 [Earliella scabrosa]|nr:hypothetical protein C8Q76DRAFT_716665 [Earliella scabrosa]
MRRSQRRVLTGSVSSSARYMLITAFRFLFHDHGKPKAASGTRPRQSRGRCEFSTLIARTHRG